MNVAELIEKLQAIEPDLEVHTQGCDCYGDVADISLRDGYILLARSDGQEEYEVQPETELGKPPPGGDPPWTGGRPTVGGHVIDISEDDLSVKTYPPKVDR